MPRHFKQPTIIQAAGNIPKIIEEYIGRVNSNTAELSIARMTSPAGWSEPPQTPDFDEYSLVLRGILRVESAKGTLEVNKGEAIHIAAGERVRYSTPHEGGAEYIAICCPAYSPATVNRDSE